MRNRDRLAPQAALRTPLYMSLTPTQFKEFVGVVKVNRSRARHNSHDVQKSSIDAMLGRMADKRRATAAKTPKREREADYERQVTVRLATEHLSLLEDIKRRSGGFATNAAIMREALAIGLREILRRYDR